MNGAHGETDTPIIEVRNVTRTYGTGRDRFTAVDGVAFHVRPGEVYGLLGTNGAGKTSTMDLIEGLATPDRGSVRVLGMDPVKDRAAVRRRTGTMLQSGGLPQDLTVRETAAMWRGTCSAPRDLGEVLESVELQHRLDVRVGALSGGEQRRLDLACALMGDPDVLFLDEPTTGLDPESRANTWRLLGDLKDRGTSMVLTTHYLEEAERLADRIGIMHRGRIRAEGTVAELTSAAPAHIGFADPGAAAEPPALPGASVTRGAGGVSVATRDLQGDALRVLRWAEAEGLRLERFEARAASLETVFLAIAGHTPDA
ncbi:ABC transporter ATP-binding protein [Corynebacterium sp. 335C]